MNVITILRLVLIIWGIIITIMFLAGLRKHPGKLELTSKKGIINALIGFLANFFDTWGIGSFAPSTFCYKTFKTSDDIDIPGNLNLGDVFPVTVEAILFLNFVDIGPLTLITMLAAAGFGAFFGVHLVTKWDVNKIRIGMGIALFFCAIVFICKLLNIDPFGTVGADMGLHGIKLIIGIVVNFFLGSFMMIGFGLYQPCMALVMLLGMSVGVAFPIMMGSCAVLMLTAAPTFIKTGRYDKNATVMNAVAGSLGAIAAYLLVAYAFDLTTLSYIVVVVMFYTAFKMFWDAKKTPAKK